MLHKVVIFYVLAFVFTIILAGIQEGASISPEAVILPQWGSGLAALVMLAIFRGDRHRFSVIDWSIPQSLYVVAVLVPLGGATAAYLINTLILGAIPFGDTAPTPWLLLLWMPLGAFGEELGWRGYLHKRLNIRLTGLPSSFIVGIMWALWHVATQEFAVVCGVLELLDPVSQRASASPDRPNDSNSSRRADEPVAESVQCGEPPHKLTQRAKQQAIASSRRESTASAPTAQGCLLVGYEFRPAFPRASALHLLQPCPPAARMAGATGSVYSVYSVTSNRRVPYR